VITYVAAVIAMAVIEMNMYGTNFKGICILFFDITRKLYTNNYIPFKLYKSSNIQINFFAKIQSF